MTGTTTTGYRRCLKRKYLAALVSTHHIGRRFATQARVYRTRHISERTLEVSCMVQTTFLVFVGHVHEGLGTGHAILRMRGIA